MTCKEAVDLFMVIKVFFPMDAVKCGKHCHHNLLRTDVTNLQYCFLSIEQLMCGCENVIYYIRYQGFSVWFLLVKNCTISAPYRIFVVCIL